MCRFGFPWSPSRSRVVVGVVCLRVRQIAPWKEQIVHVGCPLNSNYVAHTSLVSRRPQTFCRLEKLRPVMATNSTENDELELLPAQSTSDDFVMGVAAQKPASSEEANESGEKTATQDETSKRLMFELLVRVGVGSDSVDTLVSKQFRGLSDAIASDVEDGMGDFIAGHFVDCVKEFPTRSAIYAGLFSTTNIEDPEFCELVLKRMLKELNSALADQRYRNACNVLRFLAMLPKVRGITAEDLRSIVLMPLVEEYKQYADRFHPHCKEQFLACLLCAVLWGGADVLGNDASSTTLWQTLKELVENVGKSVPPSESSSIWYYENFKAFEDRIGECLAPWVKAIDDAKESGWSQKVVMIDLCKPLFVLVCAELDNALEPEEGDEDVDELEPIEPISLASIENVLTFGQSTTSIKLDTYQSCIRRNDLFLRYALDNDIRQNAMDKLTGADECILKQVIYSVLDVYFPMGGEAAEQLANIPIDAEHLVFECIFNVMLEQPEAPHPWVYYANVIAALCKTKTIYPPALAETVNNLYKGIGGTKSDGSDTEGDKKGPDQIHLAGESLERIAQWMAWHLNRFKWKWPFHWWEQFTPSQLQDTFLAGLVDRCVRISFAERIQQKFPVFLHSYLSENTNMHKNPFAGTPSTSVASSGTTDSTKKSSDDGADGKEVGNDATQEENSLAGEAPSSSDDVTLYAFSLGLFEANLKSEKVEDSIYQDLQKAEFSVTYSQRVKAFVLSLFQVSHESLSEIESSLHRFQASIKELMAGDDDGVQIFLTAVGDVWENAHTKLMNTINYLVQLRLIDGADVVRFVFYSTSLSTSGGKWLKRYWPWEMIRGALLRCLKKEYVAAPRPYAGVHRNVRDAETDKKFTEEAGLRKRCVVGISAIFSKVFAESCDGEDKKDIFMNHLRRLKNMFRNSIHEFQSELPPDSLLL